MSPNLKAFLETIGYSEGTIQVPNSDGGYRVLVGGGTFTDYSDHPRKLVKLSKTLSSTAAGKFQLLARYFDAYKKQLGLHDFSPEAQDAIAVQQIRESHALGDVEGGHFEEAIKSCAHVWASLPSAGYGQHENSMAVLTGVYLKAGGKLA